MIELSAGEIVTGVAVIVIANILVWVFAWGLSVGKISKELEARGKKDCEQDTRMEGLEVQIDNVANADHKVLPACQDTFTVLKTEQANIGGKVDTILDFIKEIKTAR